MFFHVLITLLVSTLVFNDRIYVFCDDTNKTTDTLNTILQSSGWENISNLKVRFFGNRSNTYSTSDLLNRNIAESNIIVNVNNFARKYNMTMYSLSCVYANELIKFINVTNIILCISNMERLRISSKRWRNKSSETCGLKSKTHSTDNEQANENDLVEKNYFNEPSSSVQNSEDLKHSWVIFKFAVKQFKKNWLMFEYMIEAFRFLKELVSQTYIELHLPELIYLGNIVSYYKVRSTDMQLVLPGYNEEDDNCNEDKLGEFIKQFSIFLNSLHELDRFVKNYCVIPENDKSQIVEGKDVHKTFFQPGKRTKIEDKYRVIQQLELQIDTIVNNVTQKYFKDLGFVYDFTN